MKAKYKKIQVFKAETFVVLKESSTSEISVQFLDAKHFTPTEFMLLPGEAGRYEDERYVEGLIDAYHRNPGKFRQKRKVVAS